MYDLQPEAGPGEGAPGLAAGPADPQSRLWADATGARWLRVTGVPRGARAELISQRIPLRLLLAPFPRHQLIL